MRIKTLAIKRRKVSYNNVKNFNNKIRNKFMLPCHKQYKRCIVIPYFHSIYTVCYTSFYSMKFIYHNYVYSDKFKDLFT